MRPARHGARMRRAQRLARQEAGSLQLYSDPEVKKLVEIGAEVFNVAENEILFTNSSDEALNFCFIAFCDETHRQLSLTLLMDFILFLHR